MSVEIRLASAADGRATYESASVPEEELRSLLHTGGVSPNTCSGV